MPAAIKLKELVIGDRFLMAKDLQKRSPVYKVKDKCVFNPSAGRSTRECYNETKRQYEHKVCNQDVIKLPIHEQKTG